MITAMITTGLAAATPAPPTTSYCDGGGDWKVVWEDTFDGTTLNKSIWTIPTGVGSSFGRDANVTEADTCVGQRATSACILQKMGKALVFSDSVTDWSFV
jgi:hypothetical protein